MNHEHVGIVLVSLAVILAVIAGGAMGAAPTVDTSTTDATTTTSQIQDDAVFQNVSGTDSSERFSLQVNMSPDLTPELKVQLNGSDDQVFHRNQSAENVSAAGTNSGDAHYNMSFTGADIDDVERTVNENVTLDVIAYEAANETSNDTITFAHFDFDDDRTVENIDDTDADPDTTNAPVETESLDQSLTRFTSFDIHTLEFSDLDIDDRAVNGDTTDVVIVLSNGTVRDHAADALPDDVEEGQFISRMTLVVSADEGPTQPIRVYNEGDLPDHVDEEDDTYGVFKDDGIGGEDGIEINLGEEYEDADEVSVTGRLNAGLTDALVHQASTSRFNPLNALGWFSGFGVDALTGSLPTGLLVGGPAVGYRRRRRRRRRRAGKAG